MVMGRVRIVHGAEGTIDVAGINGRGETIANAVGDFHRFIERLRRNHRGDWPKNLFLRNAHVWRDISEHGGLDEKTARVLAARQTLAATSECCAVFVLTNVDVTHDLLDGI